MRKSELNYLNEKSEDELAQKKQEEYKEWRKAARASFTSGVSALKNHLEKIYKNKITHDENVLP